MGWADVAARRLLVGLSVVDFIGNPYSSLELCNKNGHLDTLPVARECDDFPEGQVTHSTIGWAQPKFPKEVYKLVLTKAKIKTFEDYALEKYLSLEELTVSLTDLADTKFLEYLPDSIRIVELFDNKITEIAPGDFTHFYNFTELYLSNNRIQELRRNTLTGFLSLERLDLDRNNIGSIQTGFFSDLENLMYLSLRHNKLTSLANGLFNFLDNIQTILLQHNELRYFKSTVFTNVPEHLKKISLKKNPLITDPEDENLVSTALLKDSDSPNKTGCVETDLVIMEESTPIQLCY